MSLKRVVPALISFAVAATAATLAPAQDYPTRSVRFITNTAAGGTLDVLARTLADQLSQQTGQQFYVENKTGAGGTLAVSELARSAPDGYTIGMATIATHGINPTLIPKLPYDPIKDFTPIALLADLNNVLVVAPSVPAKTLREFVAYLRANPGKTFGSPGTGTGIHMAGELLKSAAKLDIAHLPYRGTAASMPDILSGRLEFMFANPPDVINLVREGKLRAIAVAAKERDPKFPDVPTFVEQGFPDIVVRTWFGVAGPANLPPAIRDRLSAEIGTALRNPKVRDKLSELGMNPAPSTPAEFASFIDAEIRRWEPIVKASGAAARN